jgi:hypothetical protein
MGEQAVMQRSLMVISGVGLAALALWAWLPVQHEVVEVASGRANAKPRLPSAGSSASVELRTLTAPAATLVAPPSATTGFAVPITVAAPQKLLVGEMNDLVVDVGANGGVSEISFTVRFDANVLQVRAGREGDWAVDAGLNTRFAAEISDWEDRVQIRSAVTGQRVGTMAGGSVAMVQFQAVAPGTTSVLTTDVVVKDVAGRSIASAVSASNLQMTVDSVPPSQPEPWRQRRAAAVEEPTKATEEGD